MSTLYYINKDLSEVHVKYLSEPILAHASAIIMSESDDLKSILMQINNCVQSMNLNLTGSIGEIVAELIF